MIAWYVEFRRLLRDIESKSRDALELYKQGGKEAARAVNGYLKSDYEKLANHWAECFREHLPSNLGRHIGFGMDGDYEDILKHDLAEIEARAEKELLKVGDQYGQFGFESLLHPIVAKASYAQYKAGHLRDAVLNSIIAVFDHIRHRTGIQADGDALIGEALSLKTPHLILSEIDSESGQNDQKGFMQIFKGAFQGIRNPKAHSLIHDLDAKKAAQYLVFASLLARRVDEAKAVKRK